METQSVVLETLVVVGLTVAIGFAVALLIKLMTRLFRLLEKKQ
ncbi:hypothetical protein FACS1894159_12180 [Bacteroidia bacterium]|nr:hypothetical protein FACS1894159_12180 [Bacteroidia bacterium]